jgi:Glyoxalase/Bleomycin resistance protein/Dioxygenase superfamily
VIRRLDHVIVAVRDRQPWIGAIGRVLGLRPGRMLEAAGEGAGGFSNAEFAIGDGFLGVVEPAGSASQLHRFLDRAGDGFYGMSIDVGDVQAATDRFAARGVDVRGRAGHGLVWAGPRQTHGVLFQVIDGMLLGQGANPRYRGLARMVVAVRDVEAAVGDYRAVFGLGDPVPVEDDPPGSRGARLGLDGSPLGQHVVLAEPTDGEGELAGHLAARGEGIFSCGIAVADLPGELDRLDRLGVAVDAVRPGNAGARGDGARIDPGALRGLRVDLLPVA